MQTLYLICLLIHKAGWLLCNLAGGNQERTNLWKCKYKMLLNLKQSSWATTLLFVFTANESLVKGHYFVKKQQPQNIFFCLSTRFFSSNCWKKKNTVICPPWAVGWGSGQDHVHGSGSCRPPCASDAGSRWAPGTPAHSACAPWSHWRAPAKAVSSFTRTVAQDWSVKQQLAVLVS